MSRLEEQFDQRLDELAAPIRQALEQEEALRLDLRGQLAASDARIKKYERILKSMEDPEVKPKAPAKTKKPRAQSYVSEEALGKVREHVLGAGEFTAPDVIAAMKLSEPTVRKAIDVLREEGTIRLAGKAPNNAMLFKVVETNAVA